MIYWVLQGGTNIASSRIHGFNIHNTFLKEGIKSKIAYPKKKTGKGKLLISLIKLFFHSKTNDAIIIQKLNIKLLKIILYLIKFKKVRIFFLDSDLPIKLDMAKLADQIIVPSIYLENKYIESQINKNVSYIPDSPEKYISPKRYKNYYKTAVWFGKGSDRKWEGYLRIKNYIEKNSLWKVFSISDRPDADFQWTNKAFEHIHKFDAVVIPVFNENDEVLSAKSANRLLQSQALGVPVLAGQMLEYEKFIKDGINGFLCKKEFDWLTSLKVLENDARWQAIANNGYSSAMQLSLKKMIKKWQKVLMH